LKQLIFRVGLFSALGGFLALEAFPALLFKHELEYENFLFHSQSPTSDATIFALAEARYLLEKSPIYERNKQYHIFNGEYRFSDLEKEMHSVYRSK